MKYLILFLLLSLAISVNAQYAPADTALIKTAFNREFDNPIIAEYLHSHDSTKVNAALLCLSHSHDTSFIYEIINLDFEKNPEYISFALGKLGASKTSTDYLLSNLDSSGINRKYILASLGLSGNSATAGNIVSNFTVEPGLPTGLVDFFRRDIYNNDIIEYLNSNLNADLAENILFELLYAVYRTQPMGSSAGILLDIATDKNIPAESRIYALGSLRKLRTFDSDKVDVVLSDPDWRIRVEGAKAAVFSDYDSSSSSMFGRYIKLLRDTNPNVSRTAAGMLKHFRMSPDISRKFADTISSEILAGGLTFNTSGEAFASMCAIIPESIPEFVDKYDRYIGQEYIIQAIGEYTSDSDWVFDYINQKLPEASEKDLLSLTPLLLELQNELGKKDGYTKTLITLLKSNLPSTISIVADGLDSSFVNSNSQILQQVVLDQCFGYMNNSQYVESIMSLVNLSERISPVFNESVAGILSSSKLPAILRAVRHDDLAAHGVIDSTRIKLFDDIFTNSFQYDSAIIKTNKGDFTIEFLSEYAPISAGNFCKLAKENYFNGISFHRVVPDFVIQTGDTTGTGWGGPGYEITSELSPLKYRRGTVGMASAGFDTEGSQWFVMHSDFPHLNGRYSIFGEVTSGMSTVDRIDQYDKIISVKLVK